MKYIRHEVFGFVLWPAESGISHAEVADVLFRHRRGNVISAGFIQSAPPDTPICFGASVTLNLSSLPGDTEALALQLNS